MRWHHRQVWWTVAQACVIALLLSGCDSTEPAEQPEEPVAGLRMEAQSKTSLTGTVGTRVDSVPVVRLVTLDGRPAPGREIRFLVSGGGSTAITSQRTDTAGVASPGAWTLGTTVRPQTLTARSAGVADLVFSVAVKAGSPAGIEIVEGDTQTAAAGATVPVPLRVHLADRYGNPVPNESVTFSVILGNGTILGDHPVTDALGFASSGAWTLGGVGAQLVKTSAAGWDVLFGAFACADPCRGRDFLFTQGSELYTVVNGDTTTLGHSGADAEWSPDAQRIAYSRYDDSEEPPSLYVLNTDGSGIEALLVGVAWYPSWAPDGTRLAVTRPDGVYLLTLSSGDVTSMLLVEHAQEAVWSPDGTKIAFVSITSDSLKVMNPDGSGVATLATIDGQGGDAGLGWPTWSPDGQRLAFTRCEAVGCDIFTLDSDGENLTQLSTVYDALEPAWSPDGSRIAFSSAGGIVWLPADGSISTPIPLVADANGFAWRP
ncbi:MAG TPA: hypothetical protein VFI41_11160 [Gemmatimonadales bacterium]|jgi:TolB protein|nr:hypothetical protein [Gemmatimonadales bacterium]